MKKRNKVLFVKPPDRFLENEFVYQQLGPYYLQSFLEQHDIPSDMLIFYEPPEVRNGREFGNINEYSLNQLKMVFLGADGNNFDVPYDQSIFENYDVVGLSVMSPQSLDACLVSETINKYYPHITTIIGGSHPRYYQDLIESLPEKKAFDFIVPQDGWNPVLQIASGQIHKSKKSILLKDYVTELFDIPPPSRPLPLMKLYNFEIAGVPAFHSITAMGCMFSCNFCESGNEKLRRFGMNAIDEDIEKMAKVHNELGHEKKAVMFFDDVGLISPRQAEELSTLVRKHGYATWRAFTHAYIVAKYKEGLLGPFRDTGGRRIGMGLETGSQRCLDIINKRNGHKQYVEDHYEAVRIANELGIAVDAFTMIFPWEDKKDLFETTKMIEFIANNPVNGIDEKGRPMKNHVDSTIMSPFQGTVFYNMIRNGQIANVALKDTISSHILYYKGNKGSSGWPYLKTMLSKEEYETEQKYRNSLRPEYR